MNDTGVACDPMRELRGAFDKRQRSDRRRLVTLRAAMRHRQDVTLMTWEELHFIAHRMCGAAAIFDFPTLAQAAQTLLDELTARALGQIQQPAQLMSLDPLIDLLFRMDGYVPEVRRKKSAR